MNGVLEFVDTADFTSMGGGEHFMCTDVEWDPTGRYVMTGVSWWGHKVPKRQPIEMLIFLCGRIFCFDSFAQSVAGGKLLKMHLNLVNKCNKFMNILNRIWRYQFVGDMRPHVRVTFRNSAIRFCT